MPGATAFITRDSDGRVQPLTSRQRRAAEQASEDDRKWFERNPGRAHHLRPAMANELPDITDEQAGKTWIVCRQMRPGIRLRWPFEPEPGFPLLIWNEAFCHALYETLHACAGGHLVFSDVRERWRMLERAGRA